MKLEEAKLQNTYKSNPNEISKERFKSKEQKGALKGMSFLSTENLNLHYF